MKATRDFCFLACKHVATWSVVALVALGLLFAGILVRLSYKPYDLSEYLPAVENLLYTEKLGGVDFDELTLSFDGDFNLIGTGVLFVGPENKPVASALQLKLSIALRSLIFGQIGFKKVLLDGLALRVTQSEGQMTIGTYIIPRQLPTKENKTQPLSVIHILSKIDNISYLKYLEVFDIKNAMLALTLAEKRFNAWHFSQTDLSFSRQMGVGEKLTLTGLLQPNEENKVPFSGLFEHRTGDSTAHISTRFEALNSRLFTTFLPENQRDIIDADIKTLELRATLDQENSFKEANIEANIGKGALRLPELYSEVKPFRSALLEMKVQPNPDFLSLHIQNLVVDAADDLLLNAMGEVRVSENPDELYTNLTLTLGAAPLSSVMSVWPDKRLGQTIKWIHERLNYKELIITNLRARLTGQLKNFPFHVNQQQTDDSRFAIEFDFDNLNIHMLEGFPQLVQVAGNGALIGDEMTLTSETGGLMKDQKAQNIHASISKLFDKEASLRVRTELVGETQPALDIIFEKEQIAPIVTGVRGTHKTTIEVKTPLNGTPDAVKFVAMTEAKNVALTLPFIAKPFKAETLHIRTDDKTITISGHGELNPFEEAWWPVDFTWGEQIASFGNNTNITGVLTSIDTPMPTLFPKLGLNVVGELKHNFTLKRDGEGSPFDVTLNTDLASGTITSQTFEWSKDSNIGGSFEMQAQFAPDMSHIDLQNITLRAPGAEIMGAFYGNIKENGSLEDVSFSFDPFIMGATNAAITFRDKNYSLIGESFNFSKIGSGNLNTKMPIEDGHYTVDIKQLTFKGGKFENVLGYIERADNKWESFDFKSLVGKSRSPLTIQLIEENESNKQKRHFEVISGDAGAALKALGVYSNLEEGRLEAILNINHEYSAFGFDADGHILIEDTYMKNAPVMARLLSLVSLQQILQADKGINFDRISLPLLMDDRVLRVKRGKLKGPNIGMNLKGHVDFANNNMKFNGALIPATAVNTIVANIPLLGTLLTGSQGAIVAADFSVKGPIEKPDVSANPFSLVTPGIFKDIWDGIAGDDE